MRCVCIWKKKMFLAVPSTVSFQARSPIFYLANAFSHICKVYFCNFLIGFPPPWAAAQVEEGKSLQLSARRRRQRRRRPASVYAARKKSAECRQLSLTFHQDAVSSGDSICVVNILKGSPLLFLPLPFIYLFFHFFYISCPPSLRPSLPDSARLIFLNCLTPKIQISQLGPREFLKNEHITSYISLSPPYFFPPSPSPLCHNKYFHLYANYYLLTKNG